MYQLTPEEKDLLLPSGNQTIMRNRVGWTRTYLKKAGLIESPNRGTFRISEEGKKVLSQKPKQIDVKLLKKYPSFKEWQESTKDEANGSLAAVKTEIEAG